MCWRIACAISGAPALAYLVLIEQAEPFATARPPEFDRALTIFEDAARLRLDR